MIPTQFLTDVASVQHYQGKTPSGVKWSQQVVYQCRFDVDSTRVKTPKGEEFTRSGTFFFNPSHGLVNLPLESKIVFEDKDYIVKQIEVLKTELGIDHIEVGVA